MLIATVGLLNPSTNSGAPPTVPPIAKELITKYCVACHSGEEPGGGVQLGDLGDLGGFYRQARIWNKAVRVLEHNEMPPASEDQPTNEEREQLRHAIDQSLSAAAEHFPCNPGKVTVRRLNRTEYNNTLRDLLGITNNPAKDLPSDPTGYGFDNIGDVLFIPPVLMEKYLDVTKAMLDQIFADPALKARLVIVEPKEAITPEEAVRQNLAAFLPLAFRRPIEPAEIEVRLQLFRESLARGRSFETAFKVALQSVLLSPNFLMRMETPKAVEPSAAKGPRRISDYELAVRLSYFLWSTMPDKQLFDLAAKGDLSKPDLLAKEVDRLIADPKSRSMADNFAAQWLRFRELLDRGVDFRSYPEFNDSLRNAMYEESAHFFDKMLRSNGKVLDVLDADYTFLNERLAKHYGIPDVKGDEIREVKLPDRRRGGVLGMGSILVVTSYPTRTSPVLRGKWVLEELFGSPPPPPPANVGSLSASSKDEEKKTLRKRLEAHRKQESCASCHKQMDPIGFGLENFDGIGTWREKEEGEPIDSLGTLPGGLEFRGPAELKAVLLKRRNVFLRTMVEKMFIYAVGRPVEYYDERAIRMILQAVQAGDARIVPMIQAIVASEPFQFSQDME